jgi:organic radical activating enzyme
MKKILLPMFEAYMTNVCNFNCAECNRLNNYKFSGHYFWADVEDDYKRWSQQIEPGFITILGGEPFLNRDLPNWIQGLRSCWPQTPLYLLTNGTQLHAIKDLYNLLKHNEVMLNIQLHNRSRYNAVCEQINNLLVPPIKTMFVADLVGWVDAYNRVKDESWPVCQSADDFDNLPEYIKKECTEIHQIDPLSWQKQSNGINLIDKNNVKVLINYSEDFVTAPLKYNGNDQFVVYNSDREKAHNACISKYCTEMVDGKLYKCHHVALLPKFMEQYQVKISDEDQKLLLSYQPLDSSASPEEIKIFLDNLKNSIPQCKLCPENLVNNQFVATTNKPKIQKIFKILQE